MARFDVFAFSKSIPFVLDVQADLLSGLNTRVVVPLLPVAQSGTEVLERLKPLITIKGQDYVLMTTDIATLPVSRLGVRIESIEQNRQRVIDALDFLFQGF